MKIIILGSGLLGITTAYVLASRGHSVEVIERQSKCGAETSYANGGQLSYSHAEPWGNPHVLAKLPKWLIHEDSPLIFRLRADMDMIRWGLKFLRNCTQTRADENCVATLRLGLYSRLKMKELVAKEDIQFDYAERGIIHVFGAQADLDYAIKHAEFQAKFGCEQTVLTADDVLRLEPTLSHAERPIVGGMHSHMDASGDAHTYCCEMATLCKEKYGVKFHYNTAVTGIRSDDGVTVAAVETENGDVTGDAYVMAMGSYSPLFLKPLGIRLPIYPMKGYSITIPANEFAPKISITDGGAKIVLSRLGERLRIAGTAEFAGYDTGLREERLAPILKAAKRLFPKAPWEADMSTWACLRPSTPGGAPLLGKTPINNLYLNTGHGTLGWTQAAGSAHIVADIIESRTPEILLGGLTL